MGDYVDGWLCCILKAQGRCLAIASKLPSICVLFRLHLHLLDHFHPHMTISHQIRQDCSRLCLFT